MLGGGLGSEPFLTLWSPHQAGQGEDRLPRQQGGVPSAFCQV